VAECQELADTVKSVEAERERNKAMAEEMEMKWKESESERKRLVAIGDKLEEQVEAMKVEMEHAERDRAEETKSEEEAKRRREEAFAAAMQCNLTKIQELERRHAAAEEADSVCRGQLEALQTEVAALEERVETVQRERERDLEALRSRLGETHVARAKYDKLRMSAVAAHNELDSQRAETTAVREELERERGRTERMVAEVEAAKSQHSEEALELHLAEVRKLRVKAESLQKQLAKVTVERDRLRSTGGAKDAAVGSLAVAAPDGSGRQKYGELMSCYKQQKRELMDLQLAHSKLQERVENGYRSLYRNGDGDGDEDRESEEEVVHDENDRRAPCWNLYDWYHDETVLNVLDDILSGDAEDADIEQMLSSLKQRHEYIHEALINNEWNVWRFVHKMQGVEDYEEAFRHLLDDHPRIYAAVHAEELLDDLHAVAAAGSDGVDPFYPNPADDDELFVDDDDYKDGVEPVDADHGLYASLHFVDADDDEEAEDEQAQSVRVHDFQSHPEYEVAFSCDSLGQLKLWSIERRDVRLLQCSNMRSDPFQQDHSALCCAIAPSGHYVAFGGKHDRGGSGLVVCYEMQSAVWLKLEFVVDSEGLSWSKGLKPTTASKQHLAAVHCLEFGGGGGLLLVGTVGRVLVLNAAENGECIQQIDDPQRNISDPVRGLRIESDFLFVLSTRRCTAYSLNDQLEGDPVEVGSALTVCTQSSDSAVSAWGPFEHLGVARFGADGLMVFVASSRLQWHLLSVDAANRTLSRSHDVATECVTGWRPTPIRSLQIDRKNGVVLVLRTKSLKSYRIGMEGQKALRSIDGASFAKIAINFGSRKHNQVAICYEKPCSIQLRKYMKR